MFLDFLGARDSSGCRTKVCHSIIFALAMSVTVSMEMKKHGSLLMKLIGRGRWKTTSYRSLGLILGISNSEYGKSYGPIQKRV